MIVYGAVLADSVEGWLRLIQCTGNCGGLRAGVPLEQPLITRTILLPQAVFVYYLAGRGPGRDPQGGHGAP